MQYTLVSEQVDMSNSNTTDDITDFSIDYTSKLAQLSHSACIDFAHNQT